MAFLFKGPNYRKPPEALEKTKGSQVDSWCRYDPLICVTEIGVEAVFIALAYSSLLFVTGGTVPSVLRILGFLATFVVLSISARMISDDLGNKLSITAVSGIGSKAVSLLAPKVVGW